MAVNTLRFRKTHLKRAARKAACFKLILALIFLQVSALLYAGFCHPLDQHDASGLVISPLESVISSFTETSQWWGGAGMDGSDDQIEEEVASLPADDDVMQLEDRMAENINKQLDKEEDEEQEKDDDERNMNSEDSNSGSSPLLQGEGLDDYYGRPHIQASRHQVPVPLVVGGSDGSGTRAFVDVLGRLGVPMLVDDPGTMDIHAAKSFHGQGWPPFAMHALQAGQHHSSNYQLSDLSSEAREQVEEELTKLKETFDRRSTNLRNRAQNKSMLLSIDVEYGFKAPITMLLLPMIQAYLYPQGFKYLHIVRDGRDVALSSNQSPVKKFYNATYADAADRLKKFESMAPVYGMQLWSDWNADLFEWEQQAGEGASGGKAFDYIVMRTEDLLNPESKFEALTLLANFVGSQKTPHELCCQSRRAVVDMGQSATNGGKRRPPPGLRTGFGNERRIKSATMMGEYRNLKFKFMEDAARAAGKEKPSNMTPRERINAMDKFRQARLNLMMEGGLVDESAKVGVITSDERHSKIEEIGNLVAERVGKRQKLTPEEGNLRKEEFRARLMERKRGKARGGDLAHMIGRRRLFGDEGLLEEHQRTGHLRRGDVMMALIHARLENAGGKTIPHSKHHPFGADLRGLPKPTPDEGRRRNDYFEERAVEKNPRNKGRHEDWREHFNQRRNKRAGYAGDEALGKVLQSQLEKLKGDAEAAPKKGNVTDRYGKWATLLQTAPELSQAMHKEGARGLKLFGYEPPQRFMDRGSDDFVCDDTVLCE